MATMEGITVLSIEQVIPAPFATHQLAESGVREIKIERPEQGDLARASDDKVRGMYGEDAAGSREMGESAALLRYEGKQVIHPSQIDTANHAFSPTDVEIRQAERIVDAMNEAEHRHQGAVTLNGKPIGLVSIRIAENILYKTRAIGEASSAER